MIVSESLEKAPFLAGRKMHSIPKRPEEKSILPGVNAQRSRPRAPQFRIEMCTSNSD